MSARRRVARAAALVAVLSRAGHAQPTPLGVRVDYPRGGELLAGGKTIRWAVTEPGGAHLTFEVEYSTDAGATWVSRARGLREPTLVLDFDQLAGCEPRRCMLRVRASNGTREGIGTSAPFTVAKKRPQVRIESPDEGAVLDLGLPTRLSGWGEDPEDGALRGGSLVWTSDLDGQLGTGERAIVTTLSEGPHVITLTGTDRDRNRASAVVRVSVERRGGRGERERDD